MNLQGRNLQREMTGADVQQLQYELGLLGFKIAPDEGRRVFFGDATTEAVQRVQKQAGLKADGLVEARTAAAINAAVELVTRRFKIVGRVSSPSRVGVGGLAVSIVDKNVGPDVVLVEGTCDAAGQFSLEFGGGDLRATGKHQPDLQARVFAGRTFLGASEVHYAASTTETLNVILPDTEEVSRQLQSEHESLISAIAQHHKGQLRDLQEDGERSDVTYVANKTGWDARAVAMAALADQFNAASGDSVPAPYFYALFRAGLPANESVFATATAETLNKVWTQASKDGIIASDAENHIPKAIKAFQALSTERLLAVPAMGGASSFDDMLSVAELDGDMRRKIAALYVAGRKNLPEFWRDVSKAVGKDISAKLQVHGKLALLTLNNAPLMKAIDPVGAPLDLVRKGLHRAKAWMPLLREVDVPPQIPGENEAARRANYGAFLAAQLRMSYPTASIAEQLRAGTLKIDKAEAIAAFLEKNEGKFELGLQPIDHYLAANNLPAEAALSQIKSLQRVMQITPNDEAMGALLKAGIDSAYHVVAGDRASFVADMAKALGGSAIAGQVYDRSVQIHGAVLNLTLSYLTAKTSTPLGAMQLATAGEQPVAGQMLNAQPQVASAPGGGTSVTAYPTLETLFGAMDYCSCDHCRSILSPAAYLVDLLQFIDRAADGKQNAQAALFDRRPDIQHLPLTCENTNTALPYIDIVNETLEYYVANLNTPLSLQGFVGHDTKGVATADLLASPQFVIDAAYATLKTAWFPAPLPFNRELEMLRRLFSKFDVPLPQAMEGLCQTSALERGANTYGWRDILMEDIGLSREQARVLTDGTLTLNQIAGFPAAMNAAQVLAALSNARDFARRAGVSYNDLVDILKARFVNPDAALIPKLDRLGVGFRTLQALHDGVLADADFLALLPTGSAAPDPAEYDGDIVAWVKDAPTYARIMAIITLVDPTGQNEGCHFDQLELRHAMPMANAGDIASRLNVVDFLRLLRFIRFWQHSGWSVELADAALCTVFRTDLAEMTSADTNTIGKLDTGFLTALPRLGIASRVLAALGLSVKKDLQGLLSCWGPIPTHGDGALYRDMFITPSMLNQDPAFAETPYGKVLTDGAACVLAHSETLRGAFKLSGPELDEIARSLGFDANTVLDLANISAIHRRGWLARKLKLAPHELLLLIQMTGLDPFAAPDIGAAPNALPPILQLIELVQSLKQRSLKTSSALYLLWNQDVSGLSAPTAEMTTEFARGLRADFAAIDDQFAVADDSGGDLLRERTTLVYGQEIADSFLAFLDDTLVLDTSYTHANLTLEPAIAAADAALTYSDFSHRLSRSGIMTSATRAALLGVAGVPQAFKDAVTALDDAGQNSLSGFFVRHPELKPLYDTYRASAAPVAQKRATLLSAFHPELARRRKYEQALIRLSTLASTNLDFARTLVAPEAGVAPLHADGDAARPLLDDIVAAGNAGLAARFFFRDTATGAVDATMAAVAELDYPGSVTLPPNPAAGAAVSAIWSGFVEIPESGFYNFVIASEDGATLTLRLDGTAQPLTQNGTTWRNTNSLLMTAGRLVAIELTVEKVRARVNVSWETPKRRRETIPARYLYQGATLQTLRKACLRFLKVATLASTLRLSADEVDFLGADTTLQIGGDGWLNVLPVLGDPPMATARALHAALKSALGFSAMKADFSPDDNRLLQVLADPAAATAQPDGLLYRLTGWDAPSVTRLLQHFGCTTADVGKFDTLSRLASAFGVLNAMGTSAAALIGATSNNPAPIDIRNLQTTLKARYSVTDWRDIIKPVNDEMREAQRDALVAHILQQFRENSPFAGASDIDTPDKLYEYFLIDVQMAACSETSRIRLALSAVQLFIERCLMNLESSVSPASIDLSQWKWRKRYRVWQANREVFLFPENWLDPELRDQKSPFFKDIEGQLLQSDITDESAGQAVLVYLQKLHDIAHLVPCGMYIEEQSAGVADDIVHVVARSQAGSGNYYYRRYEYGYWTPWEQIKLAIEDTPVTPVIWNNRLILFWLKILKQTPLAAPPAGDTSAANGGTAGVGSLNMSQVRSASKTAADRDAKIKVQALLCWSEYYNGKWQPAQTSDINTPADLGSYSPAQAAQFDRSTLTLWSDEPAEGLRITISGGYHRRAFRLFNTHSVPELITPSMTEFHGNHRSFGWEGDDYTIYYIGNIPGLPLQYFPRTPLSDSTEIVTVEATHPVTSRWDTPFFFEDRRHVFWVESEWKTVWVRDYPDYGVSVEPGYMQVPDIPPLVTKPPHVFDPGPWINPAEHFGPGIMDGKLVEVFLGQGEHIQNGLATASTVTFGGETFGPLGALGKVAVKQEG